MVIENDTVLGTPDEKRKVEEILKGYGIRLESAMETNIQEAIESI